MERPDGREAGAIEWFHTAAPGGSRIDISTGSGRRAVTAELARPLAAGGVAGLTAGMILVVSGVLPGGLFFPGVVLLVISHLVLAGAGAIAAFAPAREAPGQE